MSDLEEQFPNLRTQELSAISYYIDKMFPSQFPFLDMMTSQTICQQLLRIAGTSRVCTSSILSQSVYAQHSELSRVGLNVLVNFRDSVASYDNASLEDLKQSLHICTIYDSAETNAAIRVRTLVGATQIIISKASNSKLAVW